MTWNHRVLENKDGFTIREVLYNGEGEIITWTEEPIEPSGDTLKEMKEHYKEMAEAFTLPVLQDSDKTMEDKDYFKKIIEEGEFKTWQEWEEDVTKGGIL